MPGTSHESLYDPHHPHINATLVNSCCPLHNPQLYAHTGAPDAAGITELVAAIAAYVMKDPAFETADPASWCVLLHGLVSASLALPGETSSNEMRLTTRA